MSTDQKSESRNSPAHVWRSDHQQWSKGVFLGEKIVVFCKNATRIIG